MKEIIASPEDNCEKLENIFTTYNLFAHNRELAQANAIKKQIYDLASQKYLEVTVDKSSNTISVQALPGTLYENFPPNLYKNHFKKLASDYNIKKNRADIFEAKRAERILNSVDLIEALLISETATNNYPTIQNTTACFAFLQKFYQPYKQFPPNLDIYYKNNVFKPLKVLALKMHKLLNTVGIFKELLNHERTNDNDLYN